MGAEIDDGEVRACVVDPIGLNKPVVELAEAGWGVGGVVTDGHVRAYGRGKESNWWINGINRALALLGLANEEVNFYEARINGGRSVYGRGTVTEALLKAYRRSR